MTHEEIRDLLPGYALGALDGDEIAAVDDHLRDCREHDQELVELRATVLALGTLADEREPSAAFAAGLARLAERGEAAAPRGRRGRRDWWRPAAAAAAIVVVVFAAGWLAGVRLGAEARYSYLVQAPGGAVLQFSGISGADTVTVWMDGFDRLPAEQRYQLWAIREGRWLTIGVCNTSADGRWRGDFVFTLATDEEIALTVEPAPGSDRPTADPVLRTRF
ncbi:MAG: anti-sigma factor [Dehalococcoidia bacterium]